MRYGNILDKPSNLQEIIKLITSTAIIIFKKKHITRKRTGTDTPQYNGWIGMASHVG